MAMRFASITNLVLLSAVMLLLVHASARNLQQTQTLPLHGGAIAPNKADSPTMNAPNKADSSPTMNAPLEDQKNFIYGAGIGGAAGGFLGMPIGGGGTGMTLPLPSGTPLLGGTGGIGGLGGAMGFPGGLGGGVPSSNGASP